MRAWGPHGKLAPLCVARCDARPCFFLARRRSAAPRRLPARLRRGEPGRAASLRLWGHLLHRSSLQPLCPTNPARRPVPLAARAVAALGRRRLHGAEQRVGRRVQPHAAPLPAAAAAAGAPAFGAGRTRVTQHGGARRAAPGPPPVTAAAHLPLSLPLLQLPPGSQYQRSNVVARCFASKYTPLLC
jgi:hypothetical protein